MYIYELSYPGDWLIYEDSDEKHDVESILISMEGILTEAAISLSWFEECTSKRHSEVVAAAWEQDRELKVSIDAELRESIGESYHENFDSFQIESERRLRMKKAEMGIMPRSYLHKFPFIHAHTFVYALDSFGKLLEELATYDSVPEEAKKCHEEFNSAFPSVRKIRNSAQHYEDRVRGFGPSWDKKKGKKMDTGGFLGLSNLEGNCLCYTIDDGSYQRVEVSALALDVMVVLANRAIACFSWEGRPSVRPSY